MTVYNSPCAAPHCATNNLLSLQSLRTALNEWKAKQDFRAQVKRERQELARLPLHLLMDIGVDPIDADRESQRAESDLPAARN